MNQVHEQSEHEQKMAIRNNSVVTIKNPTDSDFSHTYAGVPYQLKAGEELPFPYPVGMLLANHLARRIARQRAMEGKDPKADKVDKKATHLYTKEIIQGIIDDEILVSTVNQPSPAVKSEGEIMKEKTEALQRQMPEATPAPKVDKREVVAELTKRGVKFNPRDSIETLMQLLTESEMAGGHQEESDNLADQVPDAQQPSSEGSPAA